MRKSVILFCILSILVSAFLLTGCGGGSGSQTPEQATKAFFAAYAKKDVNATWNMLSAESIKQLQTKAIWEKAINMGIIPANIKVGKVTVNGDKATAKVTGTVNGMTSTLIVPLFKEKGVWKVDISGATIS